MKLLSNRTNSTTQSILLLPLPEFRRVVTLVSNSHAFTLEILRQFHLRYAFHPQTVLAKGLDLVQVERFHAQDGSVHVARGSEKGGEFGVERSLVRLIFLFFFASFL